MIKSIKDHSPLHLAHMYRPFQLPLNVPRVVCQEWSDCRVYSLNLISGHNLNVVVYCGKLNQSTFVVV